MGTAVQSMALGERGLHAKVIVTLDTRYGSESAVKLPVTDPTGSGDPVTGRIDFAAGKHRFYSTHQIGQKGDSYHKLQII